MKMVKSLFLGTAAGLVAMAGAQAADLPVKAKPVQYVKVCSLYGVGFYYIPGTDTCIKIGGFVRSEWNFNAASGSFAITPNQQAHTAATTYVINRSRLLLSVDVRSQTAYGTLRAFGRAGWQWTTGDTQWGGSIGGGSATVTNSPTGTYLIPTSMLYMDRAFIQLGGWTFGRTASFYDFFPTGVYSLQTNYLHQDSSGAGVAVFAYTYAFGNGLTASLSLEDPSFSANPIVAVGAITAPVGLALAGNPNLSITPGGTSVTTTAGWTWPDLVGNVRVDQAWGSAQAQFALHNNASTYYYTTAGTAAATAGASAAASSTNTAGGPVGSALGWAIGAGVTFNLPMIAPGDTISAAVNYCEGATRYCSAPGGTRNSGAFYGMRSMAGGTIAAAWLEDAYFGNGINGSAVTGLQLSQTWSVIAGFNHKWNPQWQTSVYGGYLDYRANSSAVNAAPITVGGCSAGVVVGAPGTNASTPATGGYAGCRDFSVWHIGTRTLWNPVANLDIGVDVMYHYVNSAYRGYTLTGPTAGVAGGAAGTGAIGGNVGNVSGIFRVQRNFWP
ncbi:MAG: porin [Pseudolabrys sp.]|nr:porin [Pseudolabrys sp.]MBV9953705.1 porin [Pseudolabrys sp.]